MTPWIVLGVFVVLLVSTLGTIFHLDRKIWCVKYPPDAARKFEGGYSIRMSWWVAKDYAKIFDGKVVRYEDSK